MNEQFYLKISSSGVRTLVKITDKGAFMYNFVSKNWTRNDNYLGILDASSSYAADFDAISSDEARELMA